MSDIVWSPLVSWPSGEPQSRSTLIDVSEYDTVKLTRSHAGVMLSTPRMDSEEDAP